VAVNPYKDLPGLYGKDLVRRYEGKMIGDMPPHIFAIGNATYSSMRRTSKNQCVVIRCALRPPAQRQLHSAIHTHTVAFAHTHTHTYAHTQVHTHTRTDAH
jgi:hypothetical protein